DNAEQTKTAGHTGGHHLQDSAPSAKAQDRFQPSVTGPQGDEGWLRREGGGSYVTTAGTASQRFPEEFWEHWGPHCPLLPSYINPLKSEVTLSDIRGHFTFSTETERGKESGVIGLVWIPQTFPPNKRLLRVSAAAPVHPLRPLLRRSVLAPLTATDRSAAPRGGLSDSSPAGAPPLLIRNGRSFVTAELPLTSPPLHAYDTPIYFPPRCQVWSHHLHSSSPPAPLSPQSINHHLLFFTLIPLPAEHILICSFTRRLPSSIPNTDLPPPTRAIHIPSFLRPLNRLHGSFQLQAWPAHKR
ncbi:unnamed protein product, partial [Pleuronectes platessa]